MENKFKHALTKGAEQQIFYSLEEMTIAVTDKCLQKSTKNDKDTEILLSLNKQDGTTWNIHFTITSFATPEWMNI